jgi:Chalcone isomerase-like
VFQHHNVCATPRALLLALACGPGALWAQSAVPAEVASEMPAAKLLGSGRLTFLGLLIYDARLWVVEGFKAEAYEQTPLAIELEYGRTLYGKLIAERSLDEMKRSGGASEEQAERWLTTMKQTFPDVAKGDRITGVLRPGVSARFFLSGKPIGEVSDAEFARRFFGIWLSPKTSEPKLRLALLGPAGAASRASP